MQNGRDSIMKSTYAFGERQSALDLLSSGHAFAHHDLILIKLKWEALPPRH